MRAKQHHYTEEQKQFVRDNVKGTPVKRMTELFNERFNTNLKVTQMSGFIKRNGFKTGNDARFKKGQDAWNKGMKGVSFGGKETQFKEGNRPFNYKPVGTERINSDGYVDIKIADPNKWKAKHRIIWEEANGPIPKGHALIFGDGNKLNVTLDNLILVSRRQLALLNGYKLIQSHAELTKTGILIAELHSKISHKAKG